MTEDNCQKPSEEPSAAATTAARQRKRRKWDQPAESFTSVGLGLPGALPFVNEAPAAVATPGSIALSGSILMNSVTAACTGASQVCQGPVLQQNAAAIIQKLNQPKIQDELIAREIVINDADATIRCKLTKRQTQEEIQRSTGAVVITRGKYRSPNALPDNDRPLYLHISAGAHLKDTTDRIRAVDHAAFMIEEILKQGHSSQVLQPLSRYLYLGFDPDPALNIAARIRGPNDQYINHIMNETGVTVILRGRGSGNTEFHHAEDAQEPLHLYLSGNNPKSLEDARVLAENLLDTICLECGVSRLSSCKGYKAVPPPLQLLDGVERAGSVTGSSASMSICSAIDHATATPLTPAFSGSSICSPGSLTQRGGLMNYGHQLSPGYQSPIAGGTSYSGYGGIYPKASPLQQVALALRKAPSSTAATTITPATSMSVINGTISDTPSNLGAETDKRPPRRKFQELPVASNGTTGCQQASSQVSGTLMAGVPSDDQGVKNVSSMPPPKMSKIATVGTPPPCSRNIPSLAPPKAMPRPPSPPPKFMAADLLRDSEVPKATSREPVPDTLMKLMEYGEEDEETDVDGEEHSTFKSSLRTTSKPFWAA